MLRIPRPLILIAALALAAGALARCQSEGGETMCNDGLDNDGDGLIDCEDDDCAASEDCACGNGQIDGSEECDGMDFGGVFCSDVNPLFVGGQLTCLSTCVIDVAHCELPVCGDDVAEGNEDCDGYDMGQSASCDLLGHLGGFVSCNEEDCTYDTSGCFDEVTCDDIAIDSVVSEGAIGGLVQGGTEYTWLYESFVDLGDLKTWKLYVQLWGDYTPGGISTAPHTFTEDDLYGWASCAYCVLLMECADQACDYPSGLYLPQAGTLTMSELGEAPDGTVAGTLEDISFWRVEIGESGDSTPMPIGPCHDLYSAHTFDATVDPPQM